MWAECAVTIITVISYTMDMPSMLMMDINVMSDTTYLGTYGCPRIFLFDALPPDADEHAVKSYATFLQRMRGRHYVNATMLMFDEHMCMPEMLTRAMDHVKTPLVFVRQYDRAFLRRVPLRDIVDHMLQDKEPNVKLISFQSTGMTREDHLLHRVPTLVSGMKMTRMYYMDHSHLTWKKEYMEKLLPAYRYVSKKYNASSCYLEVYLAIYYDYLTLRELRERNYFLFGSPPADFAYTTHFRTTQRFFPLRALWWWLVHL